LLQSGILNFGIKISQSSGIAFDRIYAGKNKDFSERFISRPFHFQNMEIEI